VAEHRRSDLRQRRLFRLPAHAADAICYEEHMRSGHGPRADGRYVGVGVASFVERTGYASSEVPRRPRFAIRRPRERHSSRQPLRRGGYLHRRLDLPRWKRDLVRSDRRRGHRHGRQGRPRARGRHGRLTAEHLRRRLADPDRGCGALTSTLARRCAPRSCGSPPSPLGAESSHEVVIAGDKACLRDTLGRAFRWRTCTTRRSSTRECLRARIPERAPRSSSPRPPPTASARRRRWCRWTRRSKTSTSSGS
jgi:hypothetical protein